METRQESPDGFFVAYVRLSKTCRQHSFFENWNVNQVNQYEQTRPLGERLRTEDARFPEQHKDYPADHRIPYESIRAFDDEATGWVPRGQCAVPSPRKVEDGRCEQPNADNK